MQEISKLPISDQTTLTQVKMREIVHVQAGQCGNQIGAKFWEIIRCVFCSFDDYFISFLVNISPVIILEKVNHRIFDPCKESNEDEVLFNALTFRLFQICYFG